MTYKKLQRELTRLTDEQLDTDVTILITDVEEFYQVKVLDFTEEGDVLDAEHPILIIV